MGHAGRPPKPINWELVELYIKSGATQKRICDHLMVCKETLVDRVKDKYGLEYSVFSAGLRSEGEMLLEAAQFQKALNRKSPGDTQMLIWLGKVKLGQKEDTSNQSAKEIEQKFDESMSQVIELLSSDRNIEDNNINNETKS